MNKKDNGVVPLVSVVVPTYNQEKTVGHTLDSILAQKTDFPFEIIIGEDASPSDNTRSVCEAYAAAHPGIIRLMPKAPNKGLLRNYIDCLQECRGKYIAQCAGDDWWHNEDKLQMQVAFLEANPDYVLTFGDVILKNRITGRKTYSNPVTLSENIFKQLVAGNFIMAPTACFRADVAQAIDFEVFISEGFMMEDYPMWLIMSKIGKFHHMDQFLATYVINSGSACHAKSIEEQDRFARNSFKIIRYFTIGDDQVDPQKLAYQESRSLMGIGIYYGNWWYTMRKIRCIEQWRVRDWLRFAMLITPFGFYFLHKRARR